MPKRVTFNGKFLAFRPTGVHRVATEIITHCDQILSEKASNLNLHDWRLVKPKNEIQKIELDYISQCVKRPLVAQPWEQFTLPFYTRRDLLINLCNLSPLYSDGITMIHDAQVFISPKSYSFQFRNWYKLALPLIGKHSRGILTVSEYSKKMLLEYGIGNSDKISVIYNGVDHIVRSVPDKNILKRLSLHKDRFVCALANTQYHKNIAVLLNAFASENLKRAKLVLIGAATADDFKAMGVDVPDNVIFAGIVSDGEMRALFEAAACFAFPSLTEGFGLPPLEAMRVGCLAVVAPCGSLPEVCGDAAFYAEPHDPDEWARTIEPLLEPSGELDARRLRATAHAETFTWQRSARQLLSLVERELG